MNEQILQRRPPARSLGCLLAALAFFILFVSFVLFVRARLVDSRTRSYTPAPVWHGLGLLNTAAAARYPLFLKIRFERKHQGAGPTEGKTNLIGTAQLCLPQQPPIDLEVAGALNSWFVENGKEVTLYLRTERNTNPKLFFLLYGSWQGSQLLLEDRGTLASFFAGGRSSNQEHPKKASPSAAPPLSPIYGNSEIILHYAEKAEFDAVCPTSPRVSQE